jgi:hypothetical protein
VESLQLATDRFRHLFGTRRLSAKPAVSLGS